MANEFCSEHSGLIAEKENLKDEISRLWPVIEKLQTRLPLWATGALSFCTFVIGLLVGWIFHLQTIIKSTAKM